MTVKEALEVISDGHTFWKVDFAKDTCKAFGVPFDIHLVTHYAGQKEANPNNDPKGLWLNKDEPIDGINSLVLSNHVTRSLGLETSDKSGRGFRAQENARTVQEHLKA